MCKTSVNHSCSEVLHSCPWHTGSMPSNQAFLDDLPTSYIKVCSYHLVWYWILSSTGGQVMNGLIQKPRSSPRTCTFRMLGMLLGCQPAPLGHSLLSCIPGSVEVFGVMWGRWSFWGAGLAGDRGMLFAVPVSPVSEAQQPRWNLMARHPSQQRAPELPLFLLCEDKNF